MNPPLVVELYCGTFGWSAGWLARGGRAIGFDLEHQPWHGPVPPNAELVLQDVLTLNGAQFADADLILASPPCQEFSYRAMPWKKAKELPPPYLGMKLFWRCFQIQAEACEAAGRYIPMVVENVRGAQPWVGRARANFGSMYLWGDVPAILPYGGHQKSPKGAGGWFGDYKTRQSRGLKSISVSGSKSRERRISSATIARVPFELASFIAECYYPSGEMYGNNEARMVGAAHCGAGE